GNSVESEEALLACWKLNESLRNRVEPITIVVAMKCSSIEIGLSKKLLSSPQMWKHLMNSLDYRKNVTEALVVESGHLFDMLSQHQRRKEFMTAKWGSIPDWLNAPLFTIMDPYLRLS